jgi:hypothetical protein
LQRQRHVGAGIAVGHGIDVQAVDVDLMPAQRIPKAAHHRAQVVCAQRRQGGHGKGC